VTFRRRFPARKPALHLYMETFGKDALEMDPPILEAFIAEAGVPA